MSDLHEDARRAGYGTPLGAGVRPAVLVIDVCAAYLDDTSPLRAPVQDAVRAAALVVDYARAGGYPVVFTRVSYRRGTNEGGLFRQKVPTLAVFEEGNPLGDFLAEPAPRDGDSVIVKQYPSAFFGTPLAANLTAAGIDTLIITGLTTSGCVRATAVDALQHGFRPQVVADACGDRDPRLHEANLFDLGAKYADVIDVKQARELLL